VLIALVLIALVLKAQITLSSPTLTPYLMKRGFTSLHSLEYD